MSHITMKEKDKIVFVCPYCHQSAKDERLYTDGDTVFGVDRAIGMHWNAQKDSYVEPWDWDMLSCRECDAGCPDAMYLHAVLMSRKFMGWDCGERLFRNVYYGKENFFEAIPDTELTNNIRHAYGVAITSWDVFEYTDEQSVPVLAPMQEHFFGPFKLDTPIKGPYGVCACTATEVDYFARSFLVGIFPSLVELAEERQQLWEQRFPAQDRP